MMFSIIYMSMIIYIYIYIYLYIIYIYIYISIDSTITCILLGRPAWGSRYVCWSIRELYGISSYFIIGSMVLVYMLTLGVYWWDPCYHVIHGSYGFHHISSQFLCKLLESFCHLHHCYAIPMGPTKREWMLSTVVDFDHREWSIQCIQQSHCKVTG